MKFCWKPALLAALSLLAACAGSYDSAEKPRDGYFFVGGRYVDTDKGPMMARQMYVEYRLPATQTQPYPIVMIHGAAQTGTNFTGTPDGRKGWAQFFVERGYAVYVIDQPARGRSAYLDSLGPNIRAGQLIVLESTTYPGTTEEILQPELEKHGLRAGSDFLLAYSPEREDPGNPNSKVAIIP